MIRDENVLHDLERAEFAFIKLGYRKFVYFLKQRQFWRVRNRPVGKLFRTADIIIECRHAEVLPEYMIPALDVVIFIELGFHVGVKQFPRAGKVAFLLQLVKLINRFVSLLMCIRGKQAYDEKNYDTYYCKKKEELRNARLPSP